MYQIIEKAYAKINLGLQITGVRDDGYHLLRMIMQTVSLYDRVGIYRTHDADEISMDMDFGGRHPEEDISCGDDNLCIRAARLIAGRLASGHGYYIHLVKNIPSAAGMAGGSSDAAAVLRGINVLEGDVFSDNELRDMAVTLGADVPYCIRGGLCLCEGIGEKLTPVYSDMTLRIVLAKPAAGVSTPAAYRYYDGHPDMEHGDIDAVLDGLRKGDIEKIGKYIHNDLENAAKHFVPEISQIEEIMETEHPAFSMVTGSGPTVFGVYTSEAERRGAVSKLRDSGLCADVFSVETVTPDYEKESERN